MRGTFKKLTSRQARRSAKRAILFAMLATTGISGPHSTALGQYPSGAKMISRQQTHSMPVKIVHRAPVQLSGTPAGSVRSNPFVIVTPPVAPSAPVIQLASGSGPAVRLKPSGSSIGFAPIGGEVPGVSDVPAAVSSMSAGGTAKTSGKISAKINEQTTSSAIGGGPSPVTSPASVPEPRMIDQTPLPHTGSAATVAPAVTAEPTNAFARHARVMNVEPAPLAAVPTNVNNLISPASPVPIPEPILAGDVAPERLPMPVASLPLNHSGEGTVAIESAVVDGQNQVVPVTDARDDQSAIQETQPIFFSLSDSDDTESDESDSTDTAEPDSSAATNGASSEEQKTDVSVDPANVSPETTADGPVHMETPELPTSISLSDAAEPDTGAAPGFLSAVDTPVHLSPVVTLAEKLPSPIAGEASMIRNNPNMDDENGAPNHASGLSTTLVKPNVSRKPIAVAMPPTIITHGSEDTEFSPAVDGLAHDPTAAVNAQLPGDTFEEPEAADFDSFDGATPQVVASDLPDLNLVDQVAEDVPREVAIHVASNAPRISNVETELPPPVTESIAPELPGPSKVAESASIPETKDEPRVRAQLASAQRADVSMTPRLNENRRTTASRKPVVLNLSRAQVRSMTIAGRLRRVSIANKDVCQAFAAGANQLKLIGTGIGKTKLTIWADVAPGESTRVQTFDIDVSNDVDAIGDKISAHTALLNDSIDKAFPRASVVVSRESGKLVVTGRCDNEDTAKQIVRMVRKSCLVPVQDNLLVR